MAPQPNATPWRVVLVLSALINVALVFQALRHPRAHGPVLPPRASPTSAAACAAPDPEPPPAAHRLTATHHVAFTWASLESTNCPDYVANLRQFGIPELVLGDLVAAELEELYDSRLEAADPTPADFWARGEVWHQANLARQRLRTATEREKYQVYRVLMGVDWPEHQSDDLEMAALAQVLGDFIAESEFERTLGCFTRLEKEANLNRAAVDHILLSKDRELQLQLYEEWWAEVSARLEPVQIEELRLRVRFFDDGPETDLLGGLGLSGSEVRAIWQILVADADPLFEAFARDAGLPGAVPDRPDLAADPERLDRIRQFLGPDRAMAFERNQDPMYQDARDFANRQDLPADLAVRLYEARRLAEAAAADLRVAAVLSPEERAFQLREVAAAAELAIRDALASELAAAYLDQSGAWIKALAEAQP